MRWREKMHLWPYRPLCKINLVFHDLVLAIAIQHLGEQCFNRRSHKGFTNDDGRLSVDPWRGCNLLQKGRLHQHHSPASTGLPSPCHRPWFVALAYHYENQESAWWKNEKQKQEEKVSANWPTISGKIEEGPLFSHECPGHQSTRRGRNWLGKWSRTIRNMKITTIKSCQNLYVRYDRKVSGQNKNTLFHCLFLLSIFMPLILS